jgi:ubiquinone/menaquinone biosynthesis C-methylase UbiE
MPDVYHTVTELDPAVAEQLAAAMELRATEPQQQAMLHSYLDDLDLPDRAEVVEIGCGTGAISRVLAGWPKIAQVVGVDPSPAFIAHAVRLGTDQPNLRFEVADGRKVPLAAASMDAAVLHTVLSHAPQPELVLAEARRVVRPGGWLAVFDGDYSTVTLAVDAMDPLQACAEAFVDSYVHDPWIVRRLPQALVAAGFVAVRLRSHGYAQTNEPGYLLSVADRGADALAAQGRIGAELVAALKVEARRRVTAGTFFGHIAYASLTARVPS